VESDPLWPDLLDALGHPELLATDPRIANHVARCENAQACVALLDEVFLARPRDEWLKGLLAKGDMPISPVNTTAELLDDPQAIANDYITSHDHVALGESRSPAFRSHCQNRPPASGCPPRGSGSTQRRFIPTYS
jgi:crotonobetainyl-CoA:carnitine CoA-transferase CaiB-like acyl-CoA transferase